VVDQEGRIAWIGHPRVGLDAVLERVIAGTFDREAWAAVEARAGEIRGRSQSAARSGDFDSAVAAMDELAALDPAFAADAGLMKFGLLLEQKKDLAAACAAGEALVAGPIRDDAGLLRMVAEMLLDSEGIAGRELELAGKAAERAVAIEGRENSAYVVTLARVLWMKGERARAIELLRAAVESASDEDQKREFARTLREYEGK
jgi:tetratricopeptide (TPR) repeat protein